MKVMSMGRLLGAVLTGGVLTRRHHPTSRRLCQAKSAALRCFGALLLGFALWTPVRAQPISESDLRAHIDILASDAFGGRKPGTEGENLTLAYLAQKWADSGLVAGGKDGQWYQPLQFVTRTTLAQTASYSVEGNGRANELGRDALVLRGATRQAELRDSPLLFAGVGDLASFERAPTVAGRTVLITLSGRDTPDALGLNERIGNLVRSGAAAVLVIVDQGNGFARIAQRFRRSAVALDSVDPHPAIQGVIERNALRTMLARAGVRLFDLLAAAKQPEFVPIALPIQLQLSVQTELQPFVSHNVIARLPGSDPAAGAVLFLGHWDHFGTCREADNAEDAAIGEQGPPDHICNGAVDNASGLALLLALASELSRGPPLARDIYFLATTAEESGLFGARGFVADPPFALDRLNAVFNVDTIAISPVIDRVAVIGRGKTGLDAQIAAIAERAGMSIDDSGFADAFIRRQDGWAFLQAGLPAIMVGTAFADKERLEAFLAGPYHQPEDESGAALELRGAVADANFHLLLARHFAGNEAAAEKASGAGAMK
jgi:hypothetical protein